MSGCETPEADVEETHEKFMSALFAGNKEQLLPASDTHTAPAEAVGGKMGRSSRSAEDCDKKEKRLLRKSDLRCEDFLEGFEPAASGMLVHSDQTEEAQQGGIRRYQAPLFNDYLCNVTGQ